MSGCAKVGIRPKRRYSMCLLAIACVIPVELPTTHIPISRSSPAEGDYRFLKRRQAELDQWFFYVRLTLGLGVFGYLTVDMIAGATYVPSGILLVVGYLVGNLIIRNTNERPFLQKRWLYASLDLLMIVLIRHAFPLEAILYSNASLVGLLSLGMIVYTSYCDPKLSATWGGGAMLVLLGTFVFEGLLSYSSSPTPPFRALLLFVYIGFVGVISYRLAALLQGQMLKYSRELHLRAHAAVLTATERARRERVEEASLLQKDLVSQLEEQLVSPLSPLINALHVLEASLLLSHDDATVLNVARTSAHRLQLVVQDFKQLAAVITRDETSLISWNVSLQDLLEGLEPHLKAKLLYVREGQDHMLWGDPTLLSIAFFSLLRHLQQTLSADQPITISSFIDDQNVVVELSATAVDTEPVTLDTLDTLFRRVDGAVLFSPHTGFEQLLAQQALTRIGASVHIDPFLDEGTIIRCEIPGKKMDGPSLSPDLLSPFIQTACRFSSPH